MEFDTEVLYDVFFIMTNSPRLYMYHNANHYLNAENVIVVA